MALGEAIRRVVDGHDLAAEEMGAAMEAMLGGEAGPAEIGAFLVALRMKGETAAELAAAAAVMRARAEPVPDVVPGAVDTCGTGGDGAATLNVSTAAGLVAAAAGVPVAKHGNRAVSGAVGGADVLEALGVTLELPPVALGACLRTVGFAFLYAPALHPALRHVAGPRREIGVRTLFNLLGPLANPARVRRQVVGVAARRWVEPVAEVLVRLGATHAWVVHGEGLDEIALEGETVVAEVRDGTVALRTVSAADAGVASAPAASLRVGSVDEAAERLRGILAGDPGPGRDVVCLNAAAALVVGGVAADLRAGVVRAAEAIDTGAAAALLERLAAFTAAHARPASRVVGR
jgi:anthranilate phosphoribosyltransferase